jgi:hypothetical protein
VSLKVELRLFGGVTWARCGRNLDVTNRSRALFSMRDVLRVQIELTTDEETGGHVVLARVLRAGKRMQVFFIDFDAKQSNVRRVKPSLKSVRQARAWLLAAGYVHRQGDIGIYARVRLPASAEEIARERQPAEFADLLNRRHRFDPISNSRFFRTAYRHFVQVVSETRMLHPEHPPITLLPGLYGLKGAKGQALGREIPVRIGKPSLVEY